MERHINEIELCDYTDFIELIKKSVNEYQESGKLISGNEETFNRTNVANNFEEFPDEVILYGIRL